MTSAAPRLATIGYEQSTLDSVIGRLKDAGVEIVIDVRAIAASRRPGFSKTALSASLAEAGIAYAHLRALGTPKAGRDAARAGRVEDMRRIYEGYLEEPAAVAALEDASRIAAAKSAALLCYEAEAAGCHRAIVAERLRTRLGNDIVDL